MTQPTTPEGLQLNTRYRLEDAIGGGGMGEVHRAIDTAMFDRVVAIKVLQQTLGGESWAQEMLKQRFYTEAQISTLLGDHPNIIKILDCGVDRERQMYLVMEFLGQPPMAGKNLYHLLEAEGPLTPGRAVRLAQQICAGLHYAHSFDREVNGQRIRGVIHRDLKPSNIFVLQDPTLGNRGELVKLLDFGVAKIVSDVTVTLGTGLLGFVGTLQYSSPEQLQGKPLDPRSDIYSLGIILYQMLTGHLPVRPDTDTVWAWIDAHANRPPTEFNQLDLPQPVPEVLSRVVMTCLHKDPKQRFPSMEVLSRYLGRAWQVYRREKRITASSSDTDPQSHSRLRVYPLRSVPSPELPSSIFAPGNLVPPPMDPLPPPLPSRSGSGSRSHNTHPLAQDSFPTRIPPGIFLVWLLGLGAALFIAQWAWQQLTRVSPPVSINPVASPPPTPSPLDSSPSPPTLSPVLSDPPPTPTPDLTPQLSPTPIPAPPESTTRPSSDPSLTELEAQLETAVGHRDWDQALGLIDQMIPLFPDQSFKLQDYRSQIEQRQNAPTPTPPTPTPVPSLTPTPVPMPTPTPLSTPTPGPIPTPTLLDLPNACVRGLVELGISQPLAQQECESSAQLILDPCTQQLVDLGVSQELAQRECLAEQ